MQCDSRLVGVVLEVALVQHGTQVINSFSSVAETARIAFSFSQLWRLILSSLCHIPSVNMPTDIPFTQCSAPLCI